MKAEKTQKGLKASIAGFALSIFASVLQSMSTCWWILLFGLAMALWMFGLYWIYEERERFRESHQKSMEISGWLFGLAAAVLILGVIWYTWQTAGFALKDPSVIMDKGELHAVYNANIYFGYIMLAVAIMLACSRAFAVLEISSRRGKQVAVAALALAALFAVVLFVSVNDALTAKDKDLQAGSPVTTAFKKPEVDAQFSKIAEDNRYMVLAPALGDLLFAGAYYMANSRIERGDLKPRETEE